MKVFFDTEFQEDGRTIDLISIGMVRDDGATLYRVSSEFDEARAFRNPWIWEHVLKDKIVKGDVRFSRRQIAADILDFVFSDELPEFWAYYADYDWISLCQLYGPMVALPSGWPMYCRDLKQVIDETGITPPKQTGIEHHALADAIWVRDAFNYVQGLKCQAPTSTARPS